MPTARQLLEDLGAGLLDEDLRRLHPAVPLESEKTRTRTLLGRFQTKFPGDDDVALYSSPGRTELGGNHTDHNNGRVLAGAVTLDTLAVAAAASDVRLHSEGYPDVSLDPRDTARKSAEEGTPAAVVRGIIARLSELGHKTGGFHAVAHSSVPEGSGLSSSASFEMLVVSILNHLYNDGRIDPVICAQVGQYAENVYFGKPCGLMDQTTCAVGGVLTIDFRDPQKPQVRRIPHPVLDLALVVVNTGGSHAGLTGEYGAIRAEMEAVARVMGHGTLGEADPRVLEAGLNAIRARTGDRAVLRALHFYGEQTRVLEQARLLESGDIPGYLTLVNESGRSSWTLNQNCYVPTQSAAQPIPVALALSERLLGGQGASRVHGGGFAGTIQAYVPRHLLGRYLTTMRAVFGEHSCVELELRGQGAGKILG